MDKILLIDDEIYILKALERLLRRAGYQVLTAENAEQALQVLAANSCQVVISDYRMPDMTGGILLKQINAQYPQIICMILSGYADFNAVVNLLNAGIAFRFLQKPWDDEQLLVEVETAIHKYKANRSAHIRTQYLISSAEPLLEVTQAGTILRSNVALQQVLHTSAGELKGAQLTQLFTGCSETSMAQFLALQQSQLVVSRNGRDFEFVMQKADNEVKLIKLQLLDELPPLVTSTVNLPMVLNQNQLIQEIDNLLYDDEIFAVVSLQVRDFHLLADIIGLHDAEELFDSVAASLLTSVAQLGRLAYLANEQFVLLFPKITSEPDLHQKILQVLQVVDGRQLIKGRMVQLGFTVAYALAPEDGNSGKAILNNVLLTSRLNSKGRVDFFMRYSASLTANRKYRLQLSEALYHAIDREELSLVFQPKWDIASKKIVGAEALLRWYSNDYGHISPAVFIPIAEQDGQITEIGNWVLKRSLQYLAAWQRQGYKTLPLAVNMSVLQLQTVNFIADTLDLLKQNSIAPALLQLEITESAVMEDLDTSAIQLKALRDAGFNLAIDDFGTGYSSLAYLTRLPVDTLKIDRSLILDLDGNLSAQTMLQNIIRMAHDLKQTVVVEGVETAEQLAILVALRCDQAQGFLLSKPLIEHDYLALIATNA